MLQGVLEVADTQVRDIMVPRSQMVVVAQGSSARGSAEGHHGIEPLAVPRDRRRPRRSRRHRAGEGPAEALHRQQSAVRLAELPAARRVHPREQAPEHAAHGVSRGPQSHGDRRRRVRRRVGARDDRRRARADRRRHRRRARSRRPCRRSSRRTAASTSWLALTRIDRVQRVLQHRASATPTTTPSAASSCTSSAACRAAASSSTSRACASRCCAAIGGACTRSKSRACRSSPAE